MAKKKENSTLYCSFCGRSDRDYWMTAAEAKEYGMIDKVLERQHKDAAADQKPE